MTTARELRIAFQRYTYEIQRLPFPGAFQFNQETFAEVVAHDFVVQHKPFLTPYEMAAISNYIALFAKTKRKA